MPGEGLLGMSGVESGKAAPLFGGPPGAELHTIVDEPPSGEGGAMVPVVLPTIGVGMVPSAVVGIVAAALPITGMRAAAGTVGAAIEGEGRAGTAGGCGAGTVDPKIVDANDVAGWVGNGAVALLVVVSEIDGVADIAGVAEIDGIALLMAGVEIICAGGVPGAICPDGVEQVTTVPGVVGSDASGTGASVVSGAP